jgi:membrane protein DedA with SNARE-associated domain
MWEEILKAVPVFFSSMIKFIFGPVGGYAAGLHVVTTILSTTLGMMTIVILFAYFGNWIKAKVFSKFRKKDKPPSEKKNRKLARIWKKYGLTGVALLTPIILTPIGGTLLAVSSGSPREKIILYMFISASVWAVVLTFSIYLLGNEILPDWLKP